MSEEGFVTSGVIQFDVSVVSQDWQVHPKN